MAILSQLLLVLLVVISKKTNDSAKRSSAPHFLTLSNIDVVRKVNMWVHEEYIDNRKLTEIINTEHENVKYLPGIKLPSNIVAVDDIVTSCRNADVIVFGMPHQYLDESLQALEGRVPRDTVCVSLIKGVCTLFDLQ